MKRITALLIACCLGLLFAASTCFAQMYTVTDVGTFGGTWSSASAINASGQVVGAASFADDARDHASYHAFRTAPNSPINPATDDLGTLGGTFDGSMATGINNSGQVVGWASSPNFVQEAFRTAPNSPIKPADGFGTFGGTYSIANGINDSGQVVGYSYLPGNAAYHAFRTAPNSAVNPATDDLGTLGGSSSSAAIGINDSGQVVGYYIDNLGYWHPFRTAVNSAINPATDNLGGRPADDPAGTGEASAINAFGQVVGTAYFAEWTNIRGFRTASNSPINPATDDLGTLDRLNSVGLGSWATGINAFGQVVGASAMWNGPNRAFLYDGVMHDLNELIPVSSGWVITAGDAINDAGQIAATGYGPNSADHAVRLDPIYKALVQQPINADGSSVFKANRGVIPVKFAVTQYNSPSCTLTATIGITRAGGGTLAAVDESVYSTQSDNGSNFRIDSTACQYIYNLAASSLGVGTYRADISINGIMVGHAVFALK
jgi:probable HAF family extracellular repeat protein